MCLNSEQQKDMQVAMGGLSLETEQDTEQIVDVEEAIVHENYKETPSAVYNDIGDPCLSLIYKKFRKGTQKALYVCFLIFLVE